MMAKYSERDRRQKRIAYIDDELDLRLLITAHEEYSTVSGVIARALVAYCRYLTDEEVVNFPALLERMRAPLFHQAGMENAEDVARNRKQRKTKVRVKK